MKMVLPKHLTDIEAIELIHGPAERELRFEDFRPYQRWMTQKIMELDALLLGAEMGLGKTGATLKAASALLDDPDSGINHVLIIAPLRVAEETWPEEIATWEFSRHLKYRVVTGTQDERIAALKYGPCQITIINRENLLWLLQTLGVRRWNFDMIVYDEASRLKSGRKRSKPKKRADGTMPSKKLTELGVLQRIRHKTKKIVELSGTPAPNGLIDLYGPMYALDQGKRLGSSMTAYKRRWFREDKWTQKIEPFDHAEREIMERLDDVFFSLKEADYLKLPPMITRDHKVHMSPKEMAGYRELEREMMLEVDGRWDEPEVIEAVNNGVLTGKLLQYANGGLYREDKTTHKVHERKLEVLDSIVTEAMGRPILVAYSFKFDKDAIKKKFPFARIYGESQSDMRDWNAGKIKMLVTHPASAGHGLNFQFGSNIAVWYGLTWSLELYRQFIKRLHRSGQKADRVFLHRILTEGTADSDVVRQLERRGAVQDNITDTVRVRLERAA